MRILTLLVLLLTLLRPASADTWALLIGINEYEDRNNISSLGAADQDALALKKALTETMGVAERNIDLLVSDSRYGTPKPTRANIIEALSRLRQNVKPGDTVFVYFSGHGIQLGTKDYLLPYDFRGRDAESGVDTAYEEEKFYAQLSQVKARAIILAWDKCRNNPFSAERSGDKKRNTLTPSQAKKQWNIVSAGSPNSTGTTPILVKLFACSPQQSAYEWRAQGRGYFSYYFEQGLRGKAADNLGRITVKSLKDYVVREVAAQVKRDEDAEQTPYPEVHGPGADEFVLATGKKGGTSVPDVTDLTPDVNAFRAPVPKDRVRVIVETNVPELEATVNGKKITGLVETTFDGRRVIGVATELLAKQSLNIEIEASAPGFEPLTGRRTVLPGNSVLFQVLDPSRPRLTAVPNGASAPTATPKPPAVARFIEAHGLEVRQALGSLAITLDPAERRGKPRVVTVHPDGSAQGDPTAFDEVNLYWQAVLSVISGSVTQESATRLRVTSGETGWLLTLSRDGRVEAIERTLPGQRPRTLRVQKWVDFEGVPMPQQFQVSGERGTPQTFTVRKIEKAR
jgi:uncharacterized caspase-like protein